MGYAWLDEYCTSKKCAGKEFKPEWNATRYMIGEKMFALQGGDKDGKAIITLKLVPAYGELLRQQYKDIIPGYYMSKEHWNSLYMDGEVPDEVVRNMVDQSYELVLKSLSKRVQKTVLGE